MRDTITSSIRHIAKERSLLVVFGVLVLLCVVAAVYFGVRVQPSYNQVYTHYTSYGVVNLYASSWWYAISFSLFFVVVAILHVAIGIKIYTLKGKQLAAGFGWFSVGLVLFAMVTLTYIVNVAFPL